MSAPSKGITPVIAVILLLLITISMVGFAFVWFGRISQSVQASVENRTQSILQQQSQTIRIDNIDTTARQVAIRNTGTQSIPGSQIQVYVNGAQQANACSGSVAPGSTLTCTFTATCASGGRVRVTAPGNTDEAVCP